MSGSPRVPTRRDRLVRASSLRKKHVAPLAPSAPLAPTAPSVLGAGRVRSVRRRVIVRWRRWRQPRSRGAAAGGRCALGRWRRGDAQGAQRRGAHPPPPSPRGPAEARGAAQLLAAAHRGVQSLLRRQQRHVQRRTPRASSQKHHVQRGRGPELRLALSPQLPLSPPLVLRSPERRPGDSGRRRDRAADTARSTQIEPRVLLRWEAHRWRKARRLGVNGELCHAQLRVEAGGSKVQPADKEAVLWLGIEVARAVHHAIVLPVRTIQLKPDPLSRIVTPQRLACEAYGGREPLIQNVLANRVREEWHRPGCSCAMARGANGRKHAEIPGCRWQTDRPGVVRNRMCTMDIHGAARRRSCAARDERLGQ